MSAARSASTSWAAIHGVVREPAGAVGRRAAGTAAPTGARVSLPAAGRVSDGIRVELAGLRAQVELIRRRPLTTFEIAELNMVVFAEGRPARQAARQQEVRRDAALVGSMREASLVASMLAPGANLQRWQGRLGFEGKPTGDGRAIDPGALTWATLPMPLRWAEKDFGGHEGAEVVGLIDSIERRPGGVIFGRGAFDLGSPRGREVVRLFQGGFLSGVSLDIDSVEVARGTLSNGVAGSMVSDGRVRAATIVALPAFEDARIELIGLAPATGTLYTGTDDPHPHFDDCGCVELSTSGPVNFMPTTAARSIP